jgi:hypothetical protein
MEIDMITGGVVGFEQSRKLAEYENRKASVSFNVTEETGAEVEAQRALDLATKMVLTSLGLVKTMTNAEVAAAADPKPPRKPRGGTVDVKSPGVQATLAKQTDIEEVIETKAQISTGEARTAPDDDPAAMDDAALDPLQAEAPPVTDQVLNETISRKNLSLMADYVKLGKDKTEAPKAIRLLIGKYLPAGGQAVQMPAEVRPKFIAELTALEAVK